MGSGSANKGHQERVKGCNRPSVHSAVRTLGIVVALVSTTACAKGCVGEDVSMALARLTVRNADAALTALSDDTNCGFNSPDVLANAVIEGNTGEVGTLTLTVENCEINLEEQTVVGDPNCYTGVETRAYGRFFVTSATQTVTGSLMGLPSLPIVPDGPESVTIEATVEFHGWAAANSDQDVHLVWEEGGLSGVVRPRLAQGADLPACSVSTGNKAFWDVIYEPSTVSIESEDATLEVEVDSSNLRGADGVHRLPGQEEFIENWIEGELTIWGDTYTIPIEGDNDGLNPDYDAEEFVHSDECREGIAVPIDFDC